MSVPRSRALTLVLGLAVVFALLLPSLRPRPTPRYTVTDLGVLPGDTISSASGINNHGDIVGLSSNDFDTTRIFLVRGGRMTSTGRLKPFGESDGPAINDSGQINHRLRLSSAASTSGYEKSLPHHAILYGGSRKIDFVVPTGWMRATLRGINEQGQIIGSRSQAAFVYDSKTHKFSLLPVPPGFREGSPESINDHGQIAGLAWLPGRERAVLWNAGQPVLLEGLPGMNDSKGESVNNQGEVVGTAWTELNAAAQYINDHPLRWRLLVPFFERQWQNRAIVYKGGKAQDLNTLIPEDADWNLEEASGINDHGQIVGYGLHHGQERAFLLTPTR
jgi:hypothetical protein